MQVPSHTSFMMIEHEGESIQEFGLTFFYLEIILVCLVGLREEFRLDYFHLGFSLYYFVGIREELGYCGSDLVVGMSFGSCWTWNIP